jgi:hypothetical protein
MSTLLEELREAELIPDVSIAIPTIGYWYSGRNILKEDINPKDLQVYSVGVMAELNYRDPWMLVSGKALPNLLKQICPDVLDPTKLCDVDIEAILLASRIASYGTDMVVRHTCQMETEKGQGKGKKKIKEKCGFMNEIKIDLQKFIMRYAPFDEEGSTVSMDMFSMELPALGQKIDLMPMPYDRSLKVIKNSLVAEQGFDSLGDLTLTQFITTPEKIDQYASLFDMTSDATVEAIVSSIVCVYKRSGEAVFDKEEIRQWVLGIPLDNSTMVRERIKEISELLQDIPKVDYTCSQCKQKGSMYLHMDPQRLFTQAEVSKTPTKPSLPSSGTDRRRMAPSRTLRR